MGRYQVRAASSIFRICDAILTPMRSGTCLSSRVLAGSRECSLCVCMSKHFSTHAWQRQSVAREWLDIMSDLQGHHPLTETPQSPDCHRSHPRSRG